MTRYITQLACLYSILIPSAFGDNPARAEQAASMMPYEVVRKLRILQDQAALGNVKAYGDQRDLVTAIARKFTKVDQAVWKDTRNINAAIVYILSGGDPRFFRTLLRQGSDLPVDKELAKGALAYSEGRLLAAYESLSKIDSFGQDKSIAGNIALTQGLLSRKKNPVAAAKYLDLARILSPGTLIEESALRYQIALAAQSGDAARFGSIAGSYLRRFPGSIFLPDALRKIVSGVVRGIYGGKSANEQKLKKLGDVLLVLPVSLRRDIYLDIAAKSIVAGHAATAVWSASAAQKLAKKGSTAFVRSKVYLAATLIVTPKAAQGMQVLGTIDRSKLPARDLEILNATLVLAGEIRRQPRRPKKNPAAPLPIATKARDMIQAVDKLLAGVNK